MQACGIDFGTSNSAVGVASSGGAKLIGLESGKLDMPTTLFFNFDEDEWLFGREAIEHYIDGERGRFLRAIKSTLGTSLMHDQIQIKTRKPTFTDVISIYISQLKEKAEKSSGGQLSHVVMGRPVHFIDDDPSQDTDAQNALESAAKNAGFSSVDFQFEPIAAALSYEATLSSEKLALIVDIGGGTSDFSLVRVSPERHGKSCRQEDILATTGVHIGGTDYDKNLSLNTTMQHFGYNAPYADLAGMVLPSHFFQRLATWHLIHFMYDKQVIQSVAGLKAKVASDYKHLIDRFSAVLEQRAAHRVALSVEACKIDLSSDEKALVDLDFVEKMLQQPVALADFVDATMGLCEGVEASMLQCLSDAGVTASDVDAVFLTGGTTSVQHLRGLLLKHFPDAEIVDGDKFGSVAMGLTLQAGIV